MQAEKGASFELGSRSNPLKRPPEPRERISAHSGVILDVASEQPKLEDIVVVMTRGPRALAAGTHR